ncbi:MAG: hypothetical protein V4675_12225 [Verrucomicrobiota bacterium]
MAPSKDKTFESIPMAITSCFGILLAVGADVWAYNGLMAGRVVSSLFTAVYFTTIAATGWHFQRTGRLFSGRINSLLWLGLTILISGYSLWLAWWTVSGHSNNRSLDALGAIIAFVLAAPFAICCIVTHACVQCQKEELVQLPPPPHAILPPAKIPACRK